MWKFILVAFFVGQCLIAATIFGKAMGRSDDDKLLFCRNLISTEMQVVVMIWLIVSTFINVLFMSIM